MMDSLNIGSTILKYRKEKGMTQEKLASMIGVSSGAVSKWETGNSSPDIALLKPISRALSVSLDELLSFKADLSKKEVSEIKKKLTEIFIQDGYEEGERAAYGYLNEYPNSMGLKLAAASLFQMYGMIGGEKDKELYKARMEKALELLRDVSHSGGTEYSYTAMYLMASLYMFLERYDESEEIIKKLPHIDPMALYPTLYEKQGKEEEALKSCKAACLMYLNEAGAMLSILSRISIGHKEFDEAERYIDAVITIQDLFKIGMYSGYYNLCSLYIAEGELEKAASVFKKFAKKAAMAPVNYDKNGFFSGLKLEINENGQKAVRKKSFSAFIDNPDMEVLKGIKDYEDGLNIMREFIEN